MMVKKMLVRYTPQSSDSIKTKRDFQEDVHRKIFGRIRRKEELHEEPKSQNLLHSSNDSVKDIMTPLYG